MPLNLDGENQSLFSHNRDYDEGVKQRGIRPGQATVVVALDGSGDAESIQEGIDMLPTAGGVVYIKEGTYLIDTSIIFANGNVSIIGSGKSTIIKNNYGVWDWGASQYLIDGRTNTYGTYRDIYMDVTDSEPDYDTGGIWLGTNSMISHCWIKKTGYEAIKTSGKNEIMQIRLLDCGAGIELYSSDNICIGCISETHGDIVVWSDRNIISNNKLDPGNRSGIKIYGDRNIIIGNHITGSTQYGIWIVAGATNNICTGNNLYTNSWGNVLDSGTNTQPNGAMGTNNLAFDDLNMIT